ncbi:unnamed protein product [Rotaria magnacalcarata]|uniref:Uncharacterized protein n=2 Tax=Rotaria magnacalcarata TaxID=392030 RepID=A0A816MMH9_9BILA|nr:unnamed protein product [Rotaria magnacalcarata]
MVQFNMVHSQIYVLLSMSYCEATCLQIFKAHTMKYFQATGDHDNRRGPKSYDPLFPYMNGRSDFYW